MEEKFNKIITNVFSEENNPELYQSLITKMMENNLKIMAVVDKNKPVDDKVSHLIIESDGICTELDVFMESEDSTKVEKFDYHTKINVGLAEKNEAFYYETRHLEINLFDEDQEYIGKDENAKFTNTISLNFETDSLKRILKGNDFIHQCKENLINLNCQKDFEKTPEYQKERDLYKQKKLVFMSGVNFQKKEIARKMLSLDYEIDEITEVTGLTSTEINILKQND